MSAGNTAGSAIHQRVDVREEAGVSDSLFSSDEESHII